MDTNTGRHIGSGLRTETRSLLDEVETLHVRHQQLVELIARAHFPDDAVKELREELDDTMFLEIVRTAALHAHVRILCAEEG